VKDVFALCTLDIRHDDGLRESGPQAMARKLKGALEKRGFDSDDAFGVDGLWMFGIDIEDCEYLVGFDADDSGPNRWSVQLHLQDSGWLRGTREQRLAALKHLALATHDALVKDFEARDIEWFFDVRVRPGQGTPVPC
jgi:hypothetical protein